MQEKRHQMFRELTEAPGAPGFETVARDVMRKYIEPFADQVEFDGLGSLIARKTGKEDGPKILVAGHLDEVAFMITRITDEGFIKFQPLGGWWPQVILAQRMHIQTRTGMIEGVVGSTPPHLLSLEARRKMVEIKEMFIDIGAGSRKEAEEWGVRPGDPIIPICPFTVMKNPKMLMAKAWDNRIGCAAAIDLLQGLQGQEHPNTVYGVGTVMEEVGSRGGRTSAQHIKPDIAIAVDVGTAGDTPGINRSEVPSKLGGGVEIGMYDAGLISHEGLRNFIIDTCEELEIPYQFSFIPGGATDAAPMHTVGSGIPSICLSVATRYIHSAASVLHEDDYDNLVKLLVALVQRLDAEKVNQLRTYG
ncbi:M42 family metallopeptidase [Brevibacillus dissolubilis]|uniref:M42 family metallopeptidase n=1 Tax=Brevibacillus dissolubilis TaxID=1844116 RepID=UPI00111738A6|nr:M42 family metallopeptidase [Brevibacillus dissolubilis]